MGQRAPAEIDPAAELRMVWGLGAVAAVVAVGAFTVGGFLGMRLALTKHFDHRGNWQHTNLGAGVAIVVLSVLLAALAAGVSTVAYRFFLPRQAKLEAEARRYADSLAEKTW